MAGTWTRSLVAFTDGRFILNHSCLALVVVQRQQSFGSLFDGDFASVCNLDHGNEDSIESWVQEQDKNRIFWIKMICRRLGGNTKLIRTLARMGNLIDWGKSEAFFEDTWEERRSMTSVSEERGRRKLNTKNGKIHSRWESWERGGEKKRLTTNQLTQVSLEMT